MPREAQRQRVLYQWLDRPLRGRASGQARNPPRRDLLADGVTSRSSRARPAGAEPPRCRSRSAAVVAAECVENENVSTRFKKSGRKTCCSSRWMLFHARVGLPAAPDVLRRDIGVMIRITCEIDDVLPCRLRRPSSAPAAVFETSGSTFRYRRARHRVADGGARPP